MVKDGINDESVGVVCSSDDMIVADLSVSIDGMSRQVYEQYRIRGSYSPEERCCRQISLAA